MEGILHTVLKPIRLIKEKSEPIRKDPLTEEIEAVQSALRNVQNRFDLSTDFDSTDACIYEMEALEARYRYLIKKAKRERAEKAPIYTT